MDPKVSQQQIDLLLDRACELFEELVRRHHNNVERLRDPREFKRNPFLEDYLAACVAGKQDPDPSARARALVYPRALGTSITTSFGTIWQSLIVDMKQLFPATQPATAAGLDIEFDDAVTGIRRYCQLKAGPNTINHDDVESIHGHFNEFKSRARVNGLRVTDEQLTVGILYGSPSDPSGHYQALSSGRYLYTVLTGKDFWHRLTGVETFYDQMISRIRSISPSLGAQTHSAIEDAVQKLSQRL